jgi:hypothetical protein
LLGQPAALDFIKSVRLAENLFPFFAHADTSLITDSDNFKTKLQKVSNAIICLTMDNQKTYSAKSIAIKSGSRYVDELVVLTKSNLNEGFIEVNDPDAAIKKKEQQVKASFKVEMNDQEREARDSTTASLYHTGAMA